MKTKITPLILAAFALLFCSGCVSSGVKTETADTAAAFIRPVAKNVVNLVLAKNPNYTEALLALAAGCDVAINGGVLEAQSIKAFVDTLALKYDMDNQTKLVIASAIDDVLHIYEDRYQVQVINATDPNVKKCLAAFAKGIRDGVAFRQAMGG